MCAYGAQELLISINKMSVQITQCKNNNCIFFLSLQLALSSCRVRYLAERFPSVLENNDHCLHKAFSVVPMPHSETRPTGGSWQQLTKDLKDHRGLQLCKVLDT